MKIGIKKGSLVEYRGKAVMVGCFASLKELEGEARRIDEQSGGIIGELVREGDFKGELNEFSILYSRGLLGAARICLVGLGEKNKFSPEKLRGAFAKAACKLRDMKVDEFAVSLDFGSGAGHLGQLAEALAESFILGLYRFRQYKTADFQAAVDIKKILVMDSREDCLETIKDSIRVGEIISKSTCLVRDLVATPSNEMTPTILANKAQDLCDANDISFSVLDRAALQSLRMEALLSVARGSEEPPKLIVMEYYGAYDKEERPFVLVGKGLTFDSGGICIKPADKMDEMKSDMGGGAAVIGALMAAAELGLPLNIVGIVPATENLPDGKAYKPGDIVRSMAGKTIEVKNTDAEGRLIMADALTYAGRYNPALILDVATLTGACVVALGEQIIGMLGTDETVKPMLKKAGEETGEPVWELPLWEEYDELIKSDIADIKNSGGRYGGTITAALFLRNFIGDYPWVHLDIAGPVLLSKDRPYVPKGASGVGVRLLIRFLRDRALLSEKTA